MAQIDFFPKSQDWISKLNRDEPFYATPVSSLVLQNLSPRGLTYLGMEVAKWLIENVENSKYWYVQLMDSQWLLIFERQDFRRKFIDWFQSIEEKKNQKSKAFKDQADFWNDFDINGSIILTGKVPYSLGTDWDSGHMNQETFSLWRWMKNNMKSDLYYWSKHFYFVDPSDAILFKLTMFDIKKAA